MPRIQQLSPHVADLIAAGEVVERPASVVKELLENAIDAGASVVTVEIRRGGMSLLRVSDNGCGIDASELPVAFLRHATSKLRNQEDLAAIGTLGFRGEALAAIAAVSRVDVFSRTGGAEHGASLRLEDGIPGEVEDAGCPEGTSITVRDLFYHTPARLKFMKKDSAEATAVTGIVTHVALSHPGISFHLIKEGEETLQTPGDGSLKSAIYAALGREFTQTLIEMDGRDGDAYAVSGFLTRPLSGRGTRGMQTFFVNGRLVKSPLLTAALEEAYANRSMKGKFPGCVIHVNMPWDAVDVNVHPAKTIVKFANEKQIFDLVYHSAMRALDQDEKTRVQDAARAGTVGAHVPDMARADARMAGARVPNTAHGGSFRFSDFTKAPERHYGSLSVSSLEPDGVPSLRDRPESAARHPHDPGEPPIPEVPPDRENPPIPEEQPPEPLIPEEQTALMADEPACWRIIGEALDTYIICEDAEGSVWLIDKHAAHERVNFDRFKARQEPVMAQALLTPLVAQLDAAEYAAIAERFALLSDFGLECEDFGGNAVLIRAIPSELDEGEAVPLLEELAGQFANGQEADPAAARDALLATLSCKAAIKGGWKSDERELRVLVDKVQSGEIAYCPHGRPVSVKLSRHELEKMFQRVK